MIPVRVIESDPSKVAGRVGETDELNLAFVTVWIDGLPYVIERRYVKRVPWPIRLVAHILSQGDNNVQ